MEAEWELALEGQMGLFVASGKDRSNNNNQLMRLGLQCRWLQEPGRSFEISGMGTYKENSWRMVMNGN